MSKTSLAKPKRNGKIELFRFLFMFPVIFLHINKHLVAAPKFDSWNFVFLSPHGAISVEFFFLLSGFLMAKSAFKAYSNNGLETRQTVWDWFLFIKGKVRTLFPYHFVAFFFSFIAYVLLKDFGLLRSLTEFIKSLPSLFLVHMLGMPSPTPNPPEWYISAMLISMVIIYPLLRRYYKIVTRVAGPIAAVAILAYILIKTKSLSGVKAQLMFAYKALWRAFAELLLGATGFEICRHLEKKNLHAFIKVLFTIYEFAAVGLALAFSFTSAPRIYEFAVLALLVPVIPITFSSQTYFNNLFSNKVVYFLGKFSFYMYLVHMCPVFIAERYFPSAPLLYSILFIFGASVALSFVVEFAGNGILKLIDSKKPKTT